MKKILCLLLAVLMLLVLVACGEEDQQGMTGENGETIAETVLVDEANVKITAKAISSAALYGPEMKLLVENKTDKALVFRAKDTAINSYMVDNIMSLEVAAGQQAETAVVFASSDMNACGITTVATIEVAFRVFVAEDWQVYLETAPVTVQTSAAEGFNYTFAHEGTAVHAENGVKIVAKNSSSGSNIPVYIYNGSEQKIAVQVKEYLINGEAAESLFYEEIPVGKHLITEMLFAEEELEAMGITDITDVQVSFQIFNQETLELIADTQLAKITFQ